jgi:hypothetical protein
MYNLEKNESELASLLRFLKNTMAAIIPNGSANRIRMFQL